MTRDRAQQDQIDPAQFYGNYYRDADDDFLSWRARGAVMKVDHILDLCNGAGLDPARTLEVGCGDGAILEELARRGFGGQLGGLDVAHEPIRLLEARQLQDLLLAEVFDGSTIGQPDSSWDLGVLTHVLEHVPLPVELLREVARVCRQVVVEVPIEDNVFAVRPSHAAKAAQIGHIQTFSVASARALVKWAGLEILAERLMSVPIACHTHGAGGLRRAKALANGALREAVWRVAPWVAPHVFAINYACITQPRGGLRHA